MLDHPSVIGILAILLSSIGLLATLFALIHDARLRAHHDPEEGKGWLFETDTKSAEIVNTLQDAEGPEEDVELYLIKENRHRYHEFTKPVTPPPVTAPIPAAELDELDELQEQLTEDLDMPIENANESILCLDEEILLENDLPEAPVTEEYDLPEPPPAMEPETLDTAAPDADTAQMLNQENLDAMLNEMMPQSDAIMTDPAEFAALIDAAQSEATVYIPDDPVAFTDQSQIDALLMDISGQEVDDMREAANKLELAADAMEETSEPKRILICDKEGDKGLFLDKSISDRYLCDFANNGEQAVTFSETNAYNAILLNIFMPEMGGKPKMEELMTLNPATPILLLTHREIDKSPQELAKLGFCNVCKKPFTPDALIHLLEHSDL